MVTSRGFLILALAALGFAFGGCMSDDVTYVDKQGNKLAVDDQGRPVLPRSLTAPEPSVVTADPATGFPVVRPEDERVTLEGSPAPATRPADPNLAPTGAFPELPRLPAGTMQPKPVPEPVKPEAKKVDASEDLGKPPGG